MQGKFDSTKFNANYLQFIFIANSQTPGTIIFIQKVGLMDEMS